MLRQRLKEMDLRITELADYLQLSRPTMYKFIECYDNGEFEQINKKVLKLFNYINENELAGKRNVVIYIGKTSVCKAGCPKRHVRQNYLLLNGYLRNIQK